jgi:FkbM family methyltransferase
MREPALFVFLRKIGISAPLREAGMAMLRFVFGNYMRVKIDGHPFTVDLRDRVVSFMILFYHTYDVEEATVLRRLVRPGDRIIDIGAHIGYYSVLFGLKTGRTGRVMSIEPHPDNIAVLEKNLSDNGLNDVVTVAKVAAGAGAGEATLFEGDGNRGDNRLYRSNDKASRSFSVPVCAVDDLISWDRVDLVKMDIQGYELAAIAGMRRTLASNPEIILLTEFWPYGIRQAAGDPESMLAVLQGMGFELREITETDLVPVDPPDLLRRLDGQRWANLVCARPGVLEARA